MVRRFSTAALRVLLRIFFRRIEIVGEERIPAAGPVIFALNHPNGLVDPLFLLCFSRRPVFFLAKAPLFRMPGVGLFVRAFQSIPVYRRQDPESDVSRNRETFARARELLSRGGALALFPEGASHDDPKLRRLKTGAARIALGVAGEGLRIVPAGLYYTWKTTFRSSALLLYGQALAVEPVAADASGEPPPAPTRELTARIEAALSELTLQAESAEALDLVRSAERIFSLDSESGMSLAEELDLRRRFAAGAALLQKRDPGRFEELRARILRFETERKEAGLSLDHLAPTRLTARSFARLAAENLGALLLLPFAALGAFLHYPAYRLAGFLADRFARGQEDLLATIKAGSSLILFPATWALCAAAADILFSGRAALIAGLLAPLSGYAALRTGEALDILVGRGRALLHAFSRDSAARRLSAERQAIREEILRVASVLESPAPTP